MRREGHRPDVPVRRTLSAVTGSACFGPTARVTQIIRDLVAIVSRMRYLSALATASLATAAVIGFTAPLVA